MRYNVIMLLVTEPPGELAGAVIMTIVMMILLTIVWSLSLYPLLSAGHREEVSQLGPELRLTPLEDGVTITDHGQAHHRHLVLDTP